jgi:ATP phosphoribosyltransferase
MRAAGLKAIATILPSQAVLIQRTQPKDASHLPTIKMVTSRIAGVLAAAKYVLCTYNVERRLLDQAFKITPGRRAPTITSLDDPDWVAVSAMVEKGDSANVMDRLTDVGAHDVFLMRLDNCRV